jgi:hypothetical protein
MYDSRVKTNLTLEIYIFISFKFSNIVVVHLGSSASDLQINSDKSYSFTRKIPLKINANLFVEINRQKYPLAPMGVLA